MKLIAVLVVLVVLALINISILLVIKTQFEKKYLELKEAIYIVLHQISNHTNNNMEEIKGIIKSIPKEIIVKNVLKLP